MATPAHRLLQDQSLNIFDNGITTGIKTHVAKADKRGGGLGARKALNDISNSRKPSTLRSVKKDNSINVFSTEKDTVAIKAKLIKAPDTGKVGGRKALGDLTNSVKPPPEKVPSMSRKLNAVAEENIPSDLAEEGFLHKHQECIAAQMKDVDMDMDMDMDYFLKSAGLNKDVPVQQPSARRALQLSIKKAKYLEMEDIPEPEHLFEGQTPQCRKFEFPPAQSSPSCRSPPSPMRWENNEFSDFKVIESPKMI